MRGHLGDDGGGALANSLHVGKHARLARGGVGRTKVAQEVVHAHGVGGDEVEERPQRAVCKGRRQRLAILLRGEDCVERFAHALVCGEHLRPRAVLRQPHHAADGGVQREHGAGAVGARGALRRRRRGHRRGTRLRQRSAVSSRSTLAAAVR